MNTIEIGNSNSNTTTQSLIPLGKIDYPIESLFINAFSKFWNIEREKRKEAYLKSLWQLTFLTEKEKLLMWCEESKKFEAEIRDMEILLFQGK